MTVVFLYIRRTHTAFVGEDSSILGPGMFGVGWVGPMDFLTVGWILHGFSHQQTRDLVFGFEALVAFQVCLGTVLPAMSKLKSRKNQQIDYHLGTLYC